MNAKQAYLLLYNVVQFFGWGIILLKTTLALIRNLSNAELYKYVEFELELFQTLAILEIVHAIVGLVRSPVGTNCIQVYSRISVVWFVLWKVSLARQSLGVPIVLIAWSVTEVVRYSFYALTLINSVPQFLTWMRYTFFLVLYPMGVLGELLTVLAALPEVAVKKHFTLELPNALNFGFCYWWYLVIFAAVYPFGFPKMYMHMLKQRKKVLCIEASKKRE